MDNKNPDTRKNKKYTVLLFNSGEHKGQFAPDYMIGKPNVDMFTATLNEIHQYKKSLTPSTPDFAIMN